MIPHPTSNNVQDTTNYLDRDTGRNYLSPGVRIEGSAMARTCGVMLKKENEMRVTAANHGFLDTDEVWHPDGNGHCIGKIKERYPAEDIALFKLEGRLPPFRNHEYFAAESPKSHAREADIEQGAWGEVDGMSTGMIQLFYTTTVGYIPPRPPGAEEITYIQAVWQGYQVLGAVGTKEFQMESVEHQL